MRTIFKARCTQLLNLVSREFTNDHNDSRSGICLLTRFSTLTGSAVNYYLGNYEGGWVGRG